jgi:hypothetical protein
MTEILKESLQKEKAPASVKELALTALYIISVVALGMLVLNQWLGFHYKMQFAQSPCGVCAEANPEIKNCMQRITPVYLNGSGGLYDPTNQTIIKINMSAIS